MEIFNNNPATFNDASDTYGNIKQLYLSIFHLPRQLETNLKAFITTYNENYTSNWNQEMVFGRNDPIATFRDTNREITIAVDIPAASEQEAKSNLEQIAALTSEPENEIVRRMIDREIPLFLDHASRTGKLLNGEAV